MNWEAIGAVGEIVGAVAVVLTLVYLAVQLRQNTAAVSTSTYESVTSGFNSVNEVVVGDAEVADIFYRGTVNPESLSPAEGIRFSFLMRCWRTSG